MHHNNTYWGQELRTSKPSPSLEPSHDTPQQYSSRHPTSLLSISHSTHCLAVHGHTYRHTPLFSLLPGLLTHLNADQILEMTVVTQPPQLPPPPLREIPPRFKIATICSPVRSKSAITTLCGIFLYNNHSSTAFPSTFLRGSLLSRDTHLSLDRHFINATRTPLVGCPAASNEARMLRRLSRAVFHSLYINQRQRRRMQATSGGTTRSLVLRNPSHDAPQRYALETITSYKRVAP